MLHLECGKLPDFRTRQNYIFHPSDYFDIVYKEEWLSDSFGRSVIQTIDRIALGEDVLLSLFKQGMRPEDLCTGTKNLFLCKYIDKTHHLMKMGANCYPFLLDIAETRDVYMGVSSYCHMTDDQLKGRVVHFVNDDSYVSTAKEFLNKMMDLWGAFF